MLSSERGKESPMDLDSPPSIWCNSPVPQTSPDDKPNTPRVVFGLPPSSPVSGGTERPQVSPTKSAPRMRRFGGMFGSSPCRLRSSPLARRSKVEGDSPISEGASAKKKRALIVEERTLREKHLYLPLVVMGYVQLAFNVAVISGILYMLIRFYLMVQRDVQIKVNEQLTTLLSEISQCSKQYVENRCSPELRVPAMEKSCIMWEHCMKRDPSVVGWAKLMAETCAEIINGFIEPISYKTMIFILTAIVGTMVLSNCIFNMARNRGYPPPMLTDQSGLFTPGGFHTPFHTPGKQKALMAL